MYGAVGTVSNEDANRDALRPEFGWLRNFLVLTGLDERKDLKRLERTWPRDGFPRTLEQNKGEKNASCGLAKAIAENGTLTRTIPTFCEKKSERK